MTIITRDELYALVWAEPIQKIAPRFNISDRGLGKLCDRHGIPVPPRGWWAKKAAGKRVKQIPLPPLASGRFPKITINGQQPRVEKPPQPEASEPAEIGFERESGNFIVVEENARVTHPLVRDVSAALRSVRPDADGIIYTPVGCLDVRVSKASVSRALRILQAVVRAMEARGYSVTIIDGKTQFHVLGEPHRVFLKERLRQQIRDLTPEEHNRRRQGIEVRPYELVPSGELAFQLADYPERRIGDAKRHRLEDVLNEFIIKLVERSYENRAARARREEEERLRRQAEEHRQLAEARTRTEEARRDHFDRLVGRWRRDRERRAFLAELRAAAGELTPDSELTRWFDWAEHFIEGSSVVERFRDATGDLTLHYSGYSSDIAEIRHSGFKDPRPDSDRARRTLVGILLREGKPEKGLYKESIEITLPEAALLPYEVTEPGYVPRTFYVPARVVNAAIKIGITQPSADAGDDDEDA